LYLPYNQTKANRAIGPDRSETLTSGWRNQQAWPRLPGSPMR